MTDKPFDPFHHIDDDWTRAVYEVGKTLPSWKVDTVPLISRSASVNRMKALSSSLRKKAAAAKLRASGK